MGEKYIPYSLRRQIGDWKAEWFINNHAPALPERTPGPPKPGHERCVPAGNANQVGEIFERIANLRRDGVTGATVVSSWLRRQVQPLQCRSRLGFEYMGLYDPSRFSSEKTSRDEAMLLLYNLFEGVGSFPVLPDLFHVNNPPKQVKFCGIGCF